MKKITILSTLVAICVMLVGLQALASTNISLTPVNVNVVKNQRFTLNIGVAPQGDKYFTVKIKIEFPSDLIEVKSFSLAPEWLALNVSGYDLIDNKNGVIIKSAGVPGGSSAPATFGTITFTAKKSGTGLIKVSADSLVLDATNQNLRGNTPSVNVSISEPVAPVATPKPIVSGAPTPRPTTSGQPTATITPNNSVENATSEISEVSESKVPWESPAKGSASALSAVGNFVTLGTGNWLISIFVLIFIIENVYLISKRLKKNNIKK